MKYGIFCKSYAYDLLRVKNMYRSLEQYNIDDLPVYIAVPQDDIPLFKRSLPSVVSVLDERDLQGSVDLRLTAWRQQQVTKLAFGLSRQCDAYFVVDSDTEFLGEFKGRDLFGINDEIVLVATTNSYKYTPGRGFIERVAKGHDLPLSLVKNDLNYVFMDAFAVDERIMKKKEPIKCTPNLLRPLIPQAYTNLNTPKIKFMPTPVPLYSDPICKMHSEISSTGIDFNDLIHYSPYEFEWYGHYVLTRYLPRAKLTECFAVHFATDSDIHHAKSIGVTKATLSKNFIAVTLASRHQDSISF